MWRHFNIGFGAIVFLWEYLIFTRLATASKPLARHVVHIGVDGLKPSCMGTAANILTRLGQEGIYTLTNARTVIQTSSAPAWSTTLCSMDPTSTGVVSNAWKPPWMGNKQAISPVTGTTKPFPCVFQTIESQNSSIKTASFYAWDWLKYFMNLGIPGSVDKDVFCDYLAPGHTYGLCDMYLTQNLTEYLRGLYQDPLSQSYTFIYYSNLDVVGHHHNWCSSLYKKEVTAIDGYVGQILDAIDNHGGANSTLVMLSSDHGGELNTHGFQDNACLIIPMFIRGPGVRKNHKFHVSVRNMDMVPTALHALGLKPNIWWTGRIMLEAFGDPRYDGIEDPYANWLFDETHSISYAITCKYSLVVTLFILVGTMAAV